MRNKPTDIEEEAYLSLSLTTKLPKPSQWSGEHSLPIQLKLILVYLICSVFLTFAQSYLPLHKVLFISGGFDDDFVDQAF